MVIASSLSLAFKGCPRSICVLEMSRSTQRYRNPAKAKLPDMAGRKQVEVHKHQAWMGRQPSR